MRKAALGLSSIKGFALYLIIYFQYNKNKYQFMSEKNIKQKAYVVAVDMGYGHQRAASPLRDLAYKKQIINANTYKGIPSEDRNIWKQSRKGYEMMSRFKRVPLIGEVAWNIFDKFQEIEPFYPHRDLSEPSLQLKSTYSLIKRKKWGKHLIDKLAKDPKPIVATFFIPAFMADIFNYPGEIYCLCTDTDVSRAWAPLNPKKSKIKYLAPNHRVQKRLEMYGVKPDNIFVTGFPLPQELVGRNESILKKNLGRRLYNLDSKKKYLRDYKETIIKQLGTGNLPKKHHPLTLMFAVGGAGSQRDLGIEIVNKLKPAIKKKKINIILVAGIHNDVNKYFKDKLRACGLNCSKYKNIKIVFSDNKENYFKKFNRALAKTDILWTKPSELSFYTALGLPIIMAPPIGSQEKFNRKWLMAIGSGVAQENIDYVNEWLFDWLDSGWFAEAAMQGFLEASTSAHNNIKKILSHHPEHTEHIKKTLHY